MKMTKQDRAMLAEQYEKLFPGRGESRAKDASGYVVLRGKIIDLDKPSIKKRFWFSEHGYDWDEVHDECKRASKSEAYFKAENMRYCQAAQIIERIDGDTYQTYVPVLHDRFSHLGESDLGYVEWMRLCDWIDYIEADPECEEERLTDSELVELREFCEGEVEKFDKRLDSYLKRYGLSKCYFGTYWADR